jgi:hypothetical protein
MKITTNFGTYRPPFNVSHSVTRLLASVPAEYLIGLGEIVLTSTECLPRSRRRSVTKSRGRKVRIVTVRGLYHAAWQGKDARIEIFVDNSLDGMSRTWWLKLPLLREIVIADVLFHEIGHHIHATRRPEHREKEDVAEYWKYKLEARFFRKEYWWLVPFVTWLRVFRRPVEDAYHRASGKLPRR